ncbi:hypothetical protein [Mesorhizobium sp. B2-4-6]|uniref:hypothetical protein n=1 Tax=Mesorhizobium sp. B2-4-6 TaxID=2589943 RepID=UPI0015E44C66|nr:hypothetical protein [Mesorhizobium sp. B2-4-6]
MPLRPSRPFRDADVDQLRAEIVELQARRQRIVATILVAVALALGVTAAMVAGIL